MLVVRVGFALFPLRCLLLDLMAVSLNGPNALYNLGMKLLELDLSFEVVQKVETRRRSDRRNQTLGLAISWCGARFEQGGDLRQRKRNRLRAVSSRESKTD